MADARLGGFEELVLLAVAGLDGAGYGVTLQEHLEALSGHPIALGAVYTTLDRLERKRLVASRMADPTGERGGRRKRLYRITAAGSSSLDSMRRIRSSLWRAIDRPVHP